MAKPGTNPQSLLHFKTKLHNLDMSFLFYFLVRLPGLSQLIIPDTCYQLYWYSLQRSIVSVAVVYN